MTKASFSLALYDFVTERWPRLANWLWPTFCTRHDAPAFRGHYRWCKHHYVVLTEHEWLEEQRQILDEETALGMGLERDGSERDR